MKRISKTFLFVIGVGVMPLSAHLFANTFGKAGSASGADSMLPPQSISYTKNIVADESRSVGDLFRNGGISISMSIGTTHQGREIEAYYFPGTSPYRALIIGGMHGSELSSIAVAEEVIKKLAEGKQPYYSVVIIPSLFPDNAHAASRNPKLIGGVQNIGRYTYKNSVDPNRQMPSPGRWHQEDTRDHIGRKIENENAILLDLIRDFKPDRIANIHAIRDTTLSGIYADPRTNSKGIALGYESDSSLAIRMATVIYSNGGNVWGNNMKYKPTSLYYKDPPVAKKGAYQPRNLCGAKLPDKRGSGVSLGTWASTAVENHQLTELNRNAIRLLTIEFPGYRPPEFYNDEAGQNRSRRNVSLYASAILTVFLENYYPEYESGEKNLRNTEFARN